jgi:hypothetical protein
MNVSFYSETTYIPKDPKNCNTGIQSNYLMQHNCCTFAKIVDGRVGNQGEKCGLYYRTLSELIHHIEEEHIRKLFLTITSNFQLISFDRKSKNARNETAERTICQ